MITLRPVPHFGNFPDGRLRAGPFKSQSIQDLQWLLDQNNAHPGVEAEDKQLVSVTSQGLYLSAGGPGVTGYFLSDDGLEIESSDLCQLALDAVRPGVPFRITGHHCPDPETMIVHEATIIHDGKRVTSLIESRYIQSADGTVRRIGATPGEPSPAPLRLVS